MAMVRAVARLNSTTRSRASWEESGCRSHSPWARMRVTHVATTEPRNSTSCRVQPMPSAIFQMPGEARPIAAGHALAQQSLDQAQDRATDATLDGDGAQRRDRHDADAEGGAGVGGHRTAADVQRKVGEADRQLPP